MDKKYESSIAFKEGRLQITVVFERHATREDEELLRESYRQKYPGEKIEVHPMEGELIEKTAFFHVSLNENLNHLPVSWVPLKIHQQAPYVLPKLIEDLEEYGKDNYREPEIQLTHSLINGLRRIIESDDNSRNFT